MLNEGPYHKVREYITGVNDNMHDEKKIAEGVKRLGIRQQFSLIYWNESRVCECFKDITYNSSLGIGRCSQICMKAKITFSNQSPSMDFIEVAGPNEPIFAYLGSKERSRKYA